MDKIMQQAAQVQAEIAVRFHDRQPRFYVRRIGMSCTPIPVELDYDSPERRGPRPEHCPKDWLYQVVATVLIPRPRAYIEAESICRPPDKPNRGLGRTIVLMRLAEILCMIGWDVCAELDGDRYIIPPLEE